MPPLSGPKRQIPATAIPERPLGNWQDGQFKFNSTDAEKQWAVQAYRSGVNAQDWHRGTPIDDKTRDLVLGNLGGPTPPVYRGPDDQYRFANIHTIEPPEIRDHRLRALRGVKMDDLTGPEMPGEDELAAKTAGEGRAPKQELGVAVANDNAQLPATPSPTTPPAPASTKDDKPAATGIGIGRFAAMAEAQKKASHPSTTEVLQHIDDGVRLLANGLTLGYADNIAAAGNAAFSKGAFGANYDKFAVEEKAQTRDARERSGAIGALIESLPQLLPGAGDGLGLAGDIQMYLRDPSKLTLGNAGMTALGVLPWIPSVASTVNKVDDALEAAAKLEGKVAGKTDDVAGIAAAEKAPVPASADFDLTDAKSMEAYFKRPLKGNEGLDGHVISKHVGKTKEELLSRYTTDKLIPNSSSFYDYESAERTIQSALQKNQAAIVKWMQTPKQNALRIQFRGTDNVGISVSRDGRVSHMNTATIVIKKNDKGGFDFLTAFPGD